MPSRGTDTDAWSLSAVEDRPPVVHVAMATYNGRCWIEAQVRSIFRQRGVQIHLVVSDDGSSDGTREWLEDLAERDPRVTLLPQRVGEAGVGANFLYALEHADAAPADYVAFSDQDDLWKPDKLRRQISLIRDLDVDAVSSNVYAFWQGPNGEVKKELIRKDGPQVEWDFVFEAPSTGSSFLLTYRAWKLVADYVAHHGVEGIWLHDWYIYALVRAAGMKWFIDPEPLVAYRQHDSNELGAHQGIGANMRRLRDLLSGRYLEQFIRVHQASMHVAQESGRDTQWLEDMDHLGALLRDKSWKARLAILRRFRKIRRRPSEGLSLALARVVGVW